MKYVNAILISAIIALSFTVGVSADTQYLNLTDSGFGLGYKTSTSTPEFRVDNYVSSSTSFSVNGYNFTQQSMGFVYWAFPVNVDYTYTCTFQATFNSSSKFTDGKSFSPTGCFVSAYKQTVGTTNYNFNDKIISSYQIKKNSNYNWTVYYTISFNPTISEVPASDIYIYLTHNYYLPYNDESVTVSVNNFGTSCKYDPGGQQFQSDYSSFFEDISNQLHSGDDYTPPIQAATDLSNSFTSLDSAEASLSSKADELRTASSSTMNSALSAAKDLPNKIGTSTTFLATTFTSFWEAVPEEVTAVLLVCAAILFAGWLIGRVQ